MWWVMMREPAAVQRLDSEPAERACKSEKKVPINSLTVLPYSQTRHQHAIAQVRKEDSNTLITCRTRSQKVKDKRAALTRDKCSHSSREFYLESSLVKSSSGCPGEYPEGHVDVIMII